jgi:hypothetical protein
MDRNPYIKATISKHTYAEIVRRSELSGTTPAQYLSAIAERWFGENSPAVTKAEERLLNDQKTVKAKRAS